MVHIKVKHGKDVHDIDVDVTAGADVFKAQIQSVTNVPADRMKLMGLKVAVLKDDADLREVGLTEGKTIMLIGAPATAAPPAAASSAGDTAPPDTASSQAEAPAQPQQPAPPTAVHRVLPTVGLANVGNTCYMNSVLQVLRLVPEVVQGCQQERFLLENGASGSSTTALAASIAKVQVSMDKSDGSRPTNPVQTWLSLMQTHPRPFAELDDHQHPMQHDAQEALQVLTAAALPPAGATKSPFQGKLVQSPGTGATSSAPSGGDASEVFNMISCPITAEVSAIEVAVDIALGRGAGGPPVATASSSSSSSSSSSAAVGAVAEPLPSRRSDIAELPDVLTLHLSRFAWRADVKAKAKVLRPVTFPLVLDVNRWCTPALQTAMADEREKVKDRRDKANAMRRVLRLKPEDGCGPILASLTPELRPTFIHTTDGGGGAAAPLASSPPSPPTNGPNAGIYELFGVISHKGRYADHGHYVAWVKSGDHWYICDDENVGLVPESEVKRLSGNGEGHIAYLLFYRARDPRTGFATFAV